MYTEVLKLKLIITNKKKSVMEIHFEIEFSLPLQKQNILVAPLAYIALCFIFSFVSNNNK